MSTLAAPQLTRAQLPLAGARCWRRTPLSFRIGAIILIAHGVVAVIGPCLAPYGLARWVREFRLPA